MPHIYMKFSLPLLAVLVALASYLSILCLPPISRLLRNALVETIPLSKFIAFETTIARSGISDNIGPDGANAPGAAPGIVVASPSQRDPDCTYVAESTWSSFMSTAYYTTVMK